MHINCTIPVFDLDPILPVQKHHIRRFLKSHKDTLSNVFCPHVKPDDGQLLVPFEPRQCACFDKVADNPESGSPASSRTSHACTTNTMCCRCRATRKPERKGYFLPPENHNVSRGLLIGEQAQLPRHSYSCTECNTKYYWVRPQGSYKVYLRVQKRIEPYLVLRAYVHNSGVPTLLADPTDINWLRAIDPESWGITDDEEFKHVTCCPEKACARRGRWRELWKWPKSTKLG